MTIAKSSMTTTISMTHTPSGNYWSRVAAGLCGICGRERGPKGTTRLCPRHAKKARKKRAAWRARLRAKGVCPECSKKLVDGKCVDSSHRLENAINSARYRARHRGQ
jgi:hypothetical protein